MLQQFEPMSSASQSLVSLAWVKVGFVETAYNQHRRNQGSGTIRFDTHAYKTHTAR
jgi:hypothetical protein